MYQALYRKWRPQTFDEVIGQQHITETLKNQVKSGRLSHAYLFIGTRGTGKTTCARILARAVNCENPQNGNPCGVCPACRGILEGSVLDVVELDAASNNSVDNVRALREEAVFSPAEGKKRVYIIDEVHMLSTSAFNALLKILEEPPEHLMFILATTELQKVPATILSRCQRHSFKRIEASTIAAYLQTIAEREGFTLTPEAAELIARLAEGGVRDALSLLDQCSASERIDLDAVYNAMGLAGNRRTIQLLESILSHDTEKSLGQFEAMWMDGKDPAVLLTELTGLLRDTLMMKVAPRGGMSLISGGYDSETLLALGKRMTREELLSAMETLQNALGAMRQSTDPRTTAELCLVSLCDNTLGESVGELRARVSRLEEQLRTGAVQIAAPRQAAEEEELPPPPEEEYPEPAEEWSPEPEPVRAPEAEPVRVTAPVGASEAAPVREPNTAPAVQELEREELYKILGAALPRELATSLGDDRSLLARLEGGVLHMAAAPGFLYGRLKRPELLNKLVEAVGARVGHEIRVEAAELSETASAPKRSLDELKAFKEVHFI